MQQVKKVKNGGLETVCEMVYNPLRRGRVLKQCNTNILKIQRHAVKLEKG